jgi:hypothetical protein
MRIQNGLRVESSILAPQERGCEGSRKRRAKDARFSAHFTQMYTFSSLAI